MAGFPQLLLSSLSKELSVPYPALRAVAEVESSGSPFLPTPSLTPGGDDVSGFPVVQFEGHVFWQRLASLKIPALRPEKLIGENPDWCDIIYPRMDMRYTLTPRYEWAQLLKARLVREDEANRSASWGAFQVMGFNAELVGFPSIGEFVSAMSGLDGQLKAFVGYLKAVPATVSALRRLDFEAFARLYNGPRYKVLGYHRKIGVAYRKFAKGSG